MRNQTAEHEPSIPTVSAADFGCEPYLRPEVIDLGKLIDFTLGSAAHDTADMNTARYY